ncbi:Tegument antigen [Echinococcus granulosus]|uniref:Tegument antigen n=1 Tax=Echinococcus granulosus TaxID=6210 RepID=W6UEY0_ECHGR|nr:Tegument antigen [Echinococcus granulosus]EUB56682.1 Tegument antigen [Echinococcus granulosus]
MSPPSVIVVALNTPPAHLCICVKVQWVDWDNIDDMFVAVDTDLKGYVTRSQLTDYFRRQGIPLENVDRWFQWFEGRNKGIITIEDVCATLGIPIPVEYRRKAENEARMSEDLIQETAAAPAVFAAPPMPSSPPPTMEKSIMDGVEVLPGNAATDDILEGCVRLVKDYPGQFKQESDLAGYLKEHMEMKYRKHWQVVIAVSTIGCAVAHEVNMFIHFRYKDYIFLLYLVPDWRGL